MSWVVIDRGDIVYSTWVERCIPSLTDELKMLEWFDCLEEAEDPPVVDGLSNEGIPITTAPNGEQVEFIVVDNPDPKDRVRGAILLRRINCRHEPTDR